MTFSSSTLLSSRRARTAWAVLAALLMAALPAAAFAHVGVDGQNHPSFSMGFVHPFTGLDHLGAMLAVGLWSALAARKAWPDLLWAPLGFAGMLTVGALLGLQGVAVPAVEPMIAASLLVIGLLAATRAHLPALAAAAIVGAFAIFHGLAHGYELAGVSGAFSAIAGMLTATVLLHVTGMAIGWALRQGHAILPRAAGAGVAALGVLMLARLAAA